MFLIFKRWIFDIKKSAFCHSKSVFENEKDLCIIFKFKSKMHELTMM